jgi:hypothetical protein
MEIKFNRLNALQEKMKAAEEQKFLEQCRRRLDNIAQTKIKTTFIGAISAFEETFGFLWGYGKNDDELTDEEKKFRELWYKVRTIILNNGNTQRRALSNEISNHVVQWNKYRVDYIFGKPKGDNNEQ